MCWDVGAVTFFIIFIYEKPSSLCKNIILQLLMNHLITDNVAILFGLRSSNMAICYKKTLFFSSCGRIVYGRPL